MESDYDTVVCSHTPSADLHQFRATRLENDGEKGQDPFCAPHQAKGTHYCRTRPALVLPLWRCELADTPSRSSSYFQAPSAVLHVVA